MTQLNITPKLLSDALYAVALQRPGVPVASSVPFASEVIKELELQQQKREAVLRGDAPTPSDTEYVSLAELSAAYKRNNMGSHTAAVDIVNDIVIHREPEWKGGDIVISRSGGTFIKLLGQGSGWRNVATQVEVKYEYPTRPLKKIGVVG